MGTEVQRLSAHDEDVDAIGDPNYIRYIQYVYIKRETK